MRTLPLAALAALLAASALVPASPLACGDPCIVSTNYFGYTPPVVEIASGERVVWRSTAGGHIQADAGTEAACFATFVDGGYDSDPAKFRIVGSTLRANTTDLGDQACPNAQALPTGGFALHYECTIHPNMRGVVVVRAG